MKRICSVVAVTFMLYVAACSVAYRLRHPEMTETQLFRSLDDAFLWRE